MAEETITTEPQAVTQAQQDRMDKYLSDMAKELVTFEKYPDGFWAFCVSELGAMRIAYIYRKCKETRVYFSEGRQKWVANIETDAFGKAKQTT